MITMPSLAGCGPLSISDPTPLQSLGYLQIRRYLNIIIGGNTPPSGQLIFGRDRISYIQIKVNYQGGN